MEVELLIFDLDDTLIETEPLYIAAIRNASTFRPHLYLHAFGCLPSNLADPCARSI